MISSALRVVDMIRGKKGEAGSVVQFLSYIQRAHFSVTRGL